MYIYLRDLRPQMLNMTLSVWQSDHKQMGGIRNLGMVMHNPLSDHGKRKTSLSAVHALSQVSTIQSRDKGGQTITD